MDRINDLTQYYRKEGPVMMNKNKTTSSYEPKMMNNKRFNGVMRTYLVNGNKPITRNSYQQDSTTSSEQS
jgi:hypothetical protein